MRNGHLFNAKRERTYDAQTLKEDPRASAELENDSNFIFSLKHRPFKSDHVLRNDSELADFTAREPKSPYLEQEDLLDPDDEPFPVVNTSNFMQVLNRAHTSVIYVSSKGCHGCKRIEPLLPQVMRRLQLGCHPGDLQLV